LERIIIGKILSPHGVKGEVKVEPLTDYPERFYRTKVVWAEAVHANLEIETIREHQELFLIKFKDVGNRDQAEILTNSYLKIEPEQVMQLPPDRFFHFQIIGLQVVDHRGNLLGKISEILETGANDVYVVKRENKKDLLIPALKSIVQEIDLKENRMVVKLPAGLDE
jgi:16S rRNA processing protein RimM